VEMVIQLTSIHSFKFLLIHTYLKWLPRLFGFTTNPEGINHVDIWQHFLEADEHVESYTRNIRNGNASNRFRTHRCQWKNRN